MTIRLPFLKSLFIWVTIFGVLSGCQSNRVSSDQEIKPPISFSSYRENVCCCSSKYLTGSEGCGCDSMPYTKCSPSNSGGWRYGHQRGEEAVKEKDYCINSGGRYKTHFFGGATCDFPV